MGIEENAGIAQSVEQLIRNQQVVCSSHITSSKKKNTLRVFFFFCFFSERHYKPGMAVVKYI